jgi:hypothetical protein
MPTLTITKSYKNDAVLTENQLDDIKNSIEAFVNITRLGPDNIQPHAITAPHLASDVNEKFQKKIETIDPAWVPVGSLERAKLKPQASTTLTKLSGFSLQGEAIKLVKTTPPLTTTGGPVLLSFYTNEPGGCIRSESRVGNFTGAQVTIYRGETIVVTSKVALWRPPGEILISIPVTAVDLPPAGEHNYKLTVSSPEDNGIKLTVGGFKFTAVVL